jgi:phosphoglycolate phosphatase-like HAD superfamily hydrolase
MAGRTDRWLVERACERHGLPTSGPHLDRFRARYLALLDASIGDAGHGRRGLMPGVPDALDRLSARHRTHLALLTGNYQHGARIKLEHFGLWHRFEWGAFGDEHAERDALARAALAEAGVRGVALDDPAHAVVVGDTPFDIACARAAGARVVAVATGSHTLDELRAHAPDLALADLRDVDTLLAFIDAE